MPSGGTKDSSPGRSRQRVSRTQGWKTGNPRPHDGAAPSFCLLSEGVWSVSRRSGIPEILEVKAIVPFERAEMGRPEGAIVAVMSSIKSTYSSLLVWRTLERRQGIVESCWAGGGAEVLEVGHQHNM